MDERKKALNSRSKRRKTKLHKDRFTPPKVKVPKQEFDRILGGLIKAQPQSEKRLK